MSGEVVLDEALRVYTVHQVAEMFSVTTETLRKWLKEGRFPNAKKFGSRWRIPHGDIVALVEKGD